MDIGEECSGISNPILPTTVLFHDDPMLSTYFLSRPSSAPFPLTPPIPHQPSLWPLSDTPEFLVDTPLFYQKLLGTLPPLKTASIPDILLDMQSGTLTAYSDGSYIDQSDTGMIGLGHCQFKQTNMVAGSSLLPSPSEYSCSFGNRRGNYVL
jgi:hypothetical protein